MNVRDLIPWGRNNNQVAATYRDAEQNPFLALRREMNRLFDDAFRGFESPLALGGLPSFTGGWPNVEISETEKEFSLTAEVPGLEEKDIEVLLNDGMLTLRGDKRSETEDKDKQFSERFYGRFERRIPLGSEINEDKVEATFKNGVLKVTLPKTEQARAKTKRIAINGS